MRTLSTETSISKSLVPLKNIMPPKNLGYKKARLLSCFVFQEYLMAARLDLKNILATLTCPIGLDPLTEAVSFHCGHTINQIAAKQYYGPVVDGTCALVGKTCVVCKLP